MDAAWAENSDVLISIQRIRLQPNYEVGYIALKLYNLRVLAFCRLPPGWNVTVSDPPGNAASIEAETTFTIGALGKNDLGELSEFLLARRTGVGKPSIAGQIRFEIVGGEEGKPNFPKTTLKPENVVLEPGDLCPPQIKWRRSGEER